MIENRAHAEAGTDYPGLAAVPMDAAMMLCNNSLSSALDMLRDESAIFHSLFCGTGKLSLSPFADSLAKSSFAKTSASCVVSMHYSRDLEPLMVLSGCKKSAVREGIVSLARACWLEAEQGPDSTSVVISPSQSLVAASVRHLQVGASILDDQKFTDAASLTGGRDAVFFVGKFAPKVTGLFLSGNYVDTGKFFASYADVLAFVPEKTKTGYRLKVLDACSEKPLYRIGSIGDGKSTAAAEVLPSETVFAVSMSVGDMALYLEKYKKFLDANAKLSGYSDSAEKWAKGLDIKEIAKAEVRIENAFSQILCIKTGPKLSASVLLRDTGMESLKEYRTSILPYAYASYASKQFGSLFSIPEESYFFYRDGWIVVGSNKTLTDLLVEDSEPLSESIGKTGIKLTESPVVYYDIAANSERLGDVFDKVRMAPAIQKTIGGTSGEVFAMSGKEMTVCRFAPVASKTKADPSAVEIPSGPFAVTNSGTGKKNSLSQNADNSLVLKDEKGSTLWTKSFPGRICGAVGETDYYNNKKIQFVVVSGSKLYMLDRLGRVVKDFPAELGKEVILGPAIYDFSGAHGYSALVLHADNTIGLYDIHGRVRQGWKGIAPPEQVVTLPELETRDGKKVWKVTTVSKVYIYPFNGGDKPISKEKRKNK